MPIACRPPDQRSKTVTVRRTGQYTIIDPPVAELDRALYTVEHRLCGELDPPAVVPVWTPLLWDRRVVGGTLPECYAGLEPLVVEFLGRAGIAVRLTGKRPKPLPEPEPKRSQLRPSQPVDERLLGFVRDHDRGVIRIDRGNKVSTAWLIAQIALAWPKKRILVLVSRAADARRLVRWLKHYGIAAGLAAGRDHAPWHLGVIVCTPANLATGPVRIERRDIFVSTDPTELFNGGETFQWAIDGIKRLHKARVYALLERSAQVPPRTRDLILALFGTAAVHIPRHGYKPIPVHVAFTRIVGGDQVWNQKDDAVVKAAGIHAHHLRNRRIRQLAAALAAGDKAALRAKFPDLAEQLKRVRLGRVGIVVDTIEHGLLLARCLRWPLVAAEEISEIGLDDTERELLRRGRDEDQRLKQHVVVTPAGMPRAGTLKILIRADGGAGMPGIPAKNLVVKQTSKASLWLIDFDDRHHPLLRRWSRMRRRAYVDAGWQVAGAPEVSPLDKFIASRPEVMS